MTHARDPGGHQDRVVLGAIATCASALIVAYALTGFPLETDYSRSFESGVFPDVLHERATAWEALYGDPYRPVGEIMADHGYPGFDWGVAPRAPGALLLQLPLLLIPESWLMTVVTALILVLVFWTLWMTGIISMVEWSRLVWVGPLLYVSMPVVTAISYGSLPVMITVVLVLVSWVFRERPWAGITLGIAAASKLWPGLVIVGFWLSGQRRAAHSAVITFFAVTAAALLLPGVTLGGTVDALQAGSDAWINHNQNASLALVLSMFGVPVVVAVVVGSAIGVWLAIHNRAHAVSITAVAALLASPLSWPTYALTAMPAGASWWRRGRTVVILALSAPFLLWMFVPIRWLGHTMFASLVALLALLALDRTPATQGYPTRAE